MSEALEIKFHLNQNNYKKRLIFKYINVLCCIVDLIHFDLTHL